MIKLKFIAFYTVGLFALTSNASATTLTLGMGNTDVVITAAAGANGVASAFNDIFNFTLSGPGKVNYRVTEKEFALALVSPGSPSTSTTYQIYDIQDKSFSYGLYNSLDQLISLSNLDNLIDGAYYFKVSGLTAGLLGGQYSLNINISPVPEPQTTSMIALGLGLIGLVSLRKKQ
jgi:hypothetical protein